MAISMVGEFVVVQPSVSMQGGVLRRMSSSVSGCSFTHTARRLDTAGSSNSDERDDSRDNGSNEEIAAGSSAVPHTHTHRRLAGSRLAAPRRRPPRSPRQR